MNNTKKVLLINSSYKYLFSNEKGTCTCPPLGILSLASVLEMDGHKVSVIDCMVEIDVFSKILAIKPQIVGISATTFSFRNAMKIASFVKTNFPNALVVIGGCHASYFDVIILQKCNFIDAAIRFEGEYTFKELAAGKPLESILGLTYRKHSKIMRNDDRPLLEDLDQLPFMAMHLIRHNEYGHIHKKILIADPQKYSVIFTSRGCPRNCNFCASDFLNKKRVRFRSAKNVCEEIKTLSKKGIEFITIYDEDFLLNKERMTAICGALKQEGIHFSCMARVDGVSDSLMSLLADSGCRYIFFGIENYSEDILKYFNKKIHKEQIRIAVGLALKYKLCVLADFIIGTPIETRNDLETNTIELIRSGIDWPDIVRLSFLPGTAFWAAEVKSGRLNEKFYWDRPVFTEDIYPDKSREEILSSLEKLRRTFFFRPMYIITQIYRGFFWRFDFVKLNKLNLIYAFTPGIDKPKKDSGFN